tara:strand:+ start:5524 stop:5859 length:336 start_codon:yes stop_codon:yes gene_type:complete
MFNLDKIQNKKHEMDSGFDYIPAEKKKKIIDELTLYKKDKIYFNVLKDSVETLFYANGGEIFNYTIYDNRIELKFSYIDSNLNREKAEKIKKFLNKYQKEKIFENLKIISL